jgi:hypothetical protein
MYTVHILIHTVTQRRGAGGGELKPHEYTELQPLLSGVHSVMRVKLALTGEMGGARPPPFITFTITSKVAEYAPAEWADTLTLFHL